MQQTTPLEVDEKICYLDKGKNRMGTIIEISERRQAARIKWDNGAPRTWIRFTALVRINKTTSTILVDDQPEEFNTLIPPAFTLVSTTNSPKFFTAEGEAVIAYDAAVKVERDFLAQARGHKFYIALYEGDTLRRKTSKL